MPEIISFLGVVGSGKNYNANKLVKDKGFVHIDFKDSLLEMCSDLVGFDISADYDWFKSHLVGMRRPGNRLAEAYCHTDTREMQSRHEGLLTGRTLLQRLGTEVMRKRDSEYWTNQFHLKVDVLMANEKNVVNSDCRFPNEVEAVRASGDFKFIFCDYKSPRYDASMVHESEFLAQGLILVGLKDGDEIETSHFTQAEEIMKVKSMTAGLGECSKK